MRVAIISDLHGNEVALRAVLSDIARRGADQIVCLGDVATLGPRPEAVLELVAQHASACILGNHDEFMLEPDLVHQYTKIPVLVDSVAWCRDRLSKDALAVIRKFRTTFDLPLDNGQHLFAFHGTPDSNTTDLLATTPPEQVDQMLGEQSAAVMVGGHTHLQMLRQHRGVLLVNPGSVGVPFKEYTGGGPPRVLPHAEYATVDSDKHDVSVSLHRIALDKSGLRQAALSVDNPLSASLAEMYS